MAALAALILRVLSVLTTVLGYTQTILGFATNAAQEHTPYQLETIAANAANTVNSPTFGNAALLAAMAAFRAEAESNALAIITAISDLPQTGAPVTLPTTPPTGYGSPSDSDIFDAVWNGLEPGDFSRPWDYLQKVGQEAYFRTGYAAVYPFDDQYDWFYPSYNAYGNVYGSAPFWDTSVMLADDDLLTWLTRVNPDMECTWQGGTGTHVRVHDAINPGGNTWITTMDGPGFYALRAELFPLASGGAAPVWPGLAGVTLGTPVAITSQMTITDDMDGVIVDITSVTTNKPSLAYDTELAYKFIGALAFVSDNGDVETFQPLAFTHALYCPQRMTRATSVVLRVDAGVAGTVTPWVAV